MIGVTVPVWLSRVFLFIGMEIGLTSGLGSGREAARFKTWAGSWRPTIENIKFLLSSWGKRQHSLYKHSMAFVRRKLFFARPRQEKRRNKITNLYKGGECESAAVVPSPGKKCESAQQHQPGIKNYTHWLAYKSCATLKIPITTSFPGTFPWLLRWERGWANQRRRKKNPQA